MKNRSSDTAVFTWRLIEDSIGFNPFNLSNNREQIFTLAPSRKADIKLSFGQGSWTPHEVENLIKHLEWFEMRSARQKIKIDSLPLLKAYLLARRKGIGDRIVLLVTD